MTKQNKYDPTEHGFRSWPDDKSGNIEFRPKLIYYISKNLFHIIFLLVILFLSNRIQNRYAMMIFGIVSMLIMLFLLGRYISWMMFTKWTITENKIIIEKGVLLKTTNETNLFRVIDFEEKQSILQNIFNNTNLLIYSSDKTDPKLVLFGIKKDEKLFEIIKERVSKQREINHIHETNINKQAI